MKQENSNNKLMIRMRRLPYVTAMAMMLALGSCTNDRELHDMQTQNEEQEINFRSFIDKGTGTRATITNGDNILGFTVTGWWDKSNSEAAGITNPATNGGYLFNAFDLTRGEAGVWDYSPKLYWPSTGYGVYFYAYSPASSKHVTTGLKDYAGEKIAYTVPNPSSTESQEDFLLARTVKDEKSGTVTLNFAHALSRATFSAKKTNPGLTYLIRSVELLNINKSGKIDLKDIPTDANFAPYEPTDEPIVLWESEDAGDIAVDLGDSPIYVESDKYNSILGPTNALMIMPQTTELGDIDDIDESVGFWVRVRYKAFLDAEEGPYYAGSKGTALETYKTVYFPVLDAARSTEGNPVPHTFEIGRQYNFSLTFGTDAGEPISFAVEVGDWNDNPEITIPDINDYYGAGLISEFLAKSIKTNPKEGITLNEILSKNTLYINGQSDSDILKGLEYFQNITELRINASSNLSIDFSLLPNITTVKCGGGVSFEQIDVSSRKEANAKRVTFDVLNGWVDKNGNKYNLGNYTVSISKMLIWDNFIKKVSYDDTQDTKLLFNLHSESSIYGYFEISQIDTPNATGGTGVTITGTPHSFQ